MKKLLLCFSMLALVFSASSQCVGIEIEEYYVHPDEEIEEGVNLFGMTTYRVYAVCQNEADFVSAVFGVGATPSNINTTTSFYQNGFGGLTSDLTNVLVLETFPALEWDSWVTVGKENDQSEGPNILSAFDSEDNWTTDFDPDGGNIVLEGPIGGSWFTTYGTNDPEDANYAPNGYAGDDFKVLVAQLTTDGDVSGCLRVQVFVNGVQADSDNSDCHFFSNDEDDVPGCTDPGADNFDPLATVDDGSCLYPCAIAIDGADLTDPTCSYFSDGSIVVTSSGGQQVVEYSVNGGDPQLTGIFNDLGNGSYTITVSDAVEGCFAEMTYELNTDALTADIETTNVLCAGEESGTVCATAAGGTGAYTYGLDQEDISSDENCFGDLAAGTYTVYVLDENGCLAQSNTENITAPLGVNVQVNSQIDASCFNTTDGSVSILATGGTPGYTYSINGVDFQDGSSFADLMPDDYTLTVMDMNGCIGEGSVTIGAPNAIDIADQTMDIMCNGETNGSITVTATGGNGDFCYVFEGGDCESTNMWTDLAAGDYDIEAWDVNECNTMVTITIAEPDAVDATATAADVSCFGDTDGAINVDASGGTPGYEYSIDGNDPQSSSSFTDLAPDDYTITVIDANGCTFDVDASVGEPDELEITDANVGAESIDITVEGGTGNLEYDWTGPGNFVSTSEDIDNLDESGEYTVTVTDENGCTVTETYDFAIGIEELAGISYQLTPNPNNGQFWMQLNSTDGKVVFYNIYDVTGREITSGMANSMNSNTFIDISGEAAGMYYLRLTVEGQTATAKVSVQK